MMWDHVMEHVKTLITVDVTLTAIFQGKFRKAGVGEMSIPAIEWSLLGDTESELWAPMLVQFDCWTTKADDTRRAERRLRSLFHRPTSIRFDTYTMFSEYADGADLATPSRSNYTGRAVRFRFTPLRQQYALPAH
jgi:hypothetical protein